MTNDPYARLRDSKAEHEEAARLKVEAERRAAEKTRAEGVAAGRTAALDRLDFATVRMIAGARTDPAQVAFMKAEKKGEILGPDSDRAADRPFFNGFLAGVVEVYDEL